MIDPTGPAESDSDSDSLPQLEGDPPGLKTVTEGGFLSEQLKCAEMFKIMCNITKNVQNCC